MAISNLEGGPTIEEGARVLDIERFKMIVDSVSDETVLDLARTFVRALIESGQFANKSKLKALGSGIIQATELDYD